MSSGRYQMSIDYNILNHLGLNLYSSTPSVLAEVIANAWDADATEVKVEFDMGKTEIIISDNGCGMDQNDINNKYLLVGYQKRKGSKDYTTPEGRRPMGRKGIGKLSLFSIADHIYVYSKKFNSDEEAFLMDAQVIKNKIEKSNSGDGTPYEPSELLEKVGIKNHGTVIKIAKLKQIKLTKASIDGLRRKIARRFSIIEDPLKEFKVFVNGSEVGLAERDYFDKAKYLFQYGDHDYSEYCGKLDQEKKSGKKIIRVKSGRFNKNGKKNSNGQYAITGWVAIAHHTSDLDDKDDGKKIVGEYGENLNKVSIVVRGKMAKENVLQESRIASQSAQYMYGEIIADFLDEDFNEDIATSDRQGFKESDERIIALNLFLANELRQIGIETDKLKQKSGYDSVLSLLPSIENWFDSLDALQKNSAKKLFGKINQLPIDDLEEKRRLFISSIFAFENLRLRNILDRLDKIPASSVAMLGEVFSQLDDLEASTYYETAKRRVRVIDKLIMLLQKNEYENEIRDHLFAHPWLLNPSWEGGSMISLKERGPGRVITENEVARKFKREIKGNMSSEEWNSRFDLYYLSSTDGHVIIELKRAEKDLDTFELSKQIAKYSRAMEKILENLSSVSNEYKIICILDTELKDWSNQGGLERSIEIFKVDKAKVIMYTDLINNSKIKYENFYTARAEASRITDLINIIEQSYSGTIL